MEPTNIGLPGKSPLNRHVCVCVNSGGFRGTRYFGRPITVCCSADVCFLSFFQQSPWRPIISEHTGPIFTKLFCSLRQNRKHAISIPENTPWNKWEKRAPLPCLLLTLLWRALCCRQHAGLCYAFLGWYHFYNGNLTEFVCWRRILTFNFLNRNSRWPAVTKEKYKWAT